MYSRYSPNRNFPGVTRVVLVDWTSPAPDAPDLRGSVFERWGVAVQLDVQDEGRTLKIFVKDLVKETTNDDASHPAQGS